MIHWTQVIFPKPRTRQVGQFWPEMDRLSQKSFYPKRSRGDLVTEFFLDKGFLIHHKHIISYPVPERVLASRIPTLGGDGGDDERMNE